MVRVCTECGAEVGTPHKRIGTFIWKKKPRNLILIKKEREAEAVVAYTGGGG